MEYPLVSILVPVFNGEAYLRNSIESAREQTIQDIEILILNDASTDRTVEIVQELMVNDSRISLHCNQQNIGVAKTRNYGFTLAKGKYIALLDADDIWAPNKLELQLEQIKKYSLDVCYTGYSFIDANGSPIGKPYSVPEKLTIKRLIAENVVGCSTVLLRKELAAQVQMRPKFAHEDYVFWLELMQNGYKFGGVNKQLVWYRVTKESRSGDKKRAVINRWRIYRDFLKMNPLSAGIAFSSYAVRGFYKHLK